MTDTLTMDKFSVVFGGRGMDDLLIELGGLELYPPLGFDAGDGNLYRYVGNDPTNETDPTGLADTPVYTGKDIGDSLRKGLKKLEQDFNKLSDAQKLEIASKFTNCPTRSMHGISPRSLERTWKDSALLVGNGALETELALLLWMASPTRRQQ